MVLLVPMLAGAGGTAGGAAWALEHLDGHTIVTGYGAAARRLTTVLRRARLPYVVTTLSPGGADEAEQEGHPVLRGDSSRARTLELVGIQRARMLVIADDEPIMARRIAAVGRTSNPSIRILERTRYVTEIEPLRAAGADVVITEELESIVQVFAEVLRVYHVDPDEIECYEQEIRVHGCRALDAAQDHADIEPCHSGDACDPASAQHEPAAAALAADDGRGGKVRRAPPDEAPESARASAAGTIHDDHAGRTMIDTQRRYRLDAPPDPRRCSHAEDVRAVNPSAPGCEDCLAIGDTWVHLRLCMTCGHVGCCDSSRNRHATRHYHATGHPIVRSLEPGEDWAWCYEDRVTL